MNALSRLLASGRPLLADGATGTNLFAMGSMVATSGQGIPVDFTFGLDLLLDGLERRLAGQEAPKAERLTVVRGRIRFGRRA